jgi:hypothetical protein
VRRYLGRERLTEESGERDKFVVYEAMGPLLDRCLSKGREGNVACISMLAIPLKAGTRYLVQKPCYLDMGGPRLTVRGERSFEAFMLGV